LDKHSFHITYTQATEHSVKLAIDNVLVNFFNFLKFNKFTPKNLNIKIGIEKDCHFQLSKTFINNLLSKEFHHEKWFEHSPRIEENGEPDFLGSCFYMINCLQEYAPSPLDSLGRFDFECSYQCKFQCTEDHLVLTYFQNIAQVLFGSPIPLQQSQYLLSHDIDALNSSWKEKLKKQIYNLSFKQALQTFIARIQGKDDWQNIEDILEDETRLQISSTFFWLGEEGRTKFKGVKNSDYKIEEAYVQNCLSKIESSALHQNGLHKSISSMPFEKELEQLPATTHNRFHYLKFNIPQDFQILSDSNITADYSLGFSKNIGFRNSYGLPFVPFNPITLTYYKFTAYPLHIMDSSLFYYMDFQSLEAMYAKVASFIEQHPKSALISILWHNNFYQKKDYHQLLQIIKMNLANYSK
jgi:hypothetical protein